MTGKKNQTQIKGTCRNKSKVTEVGGYRFGNLSDLRNGPLSSNVAWESRHANSWRPLRLPPSSLSRNGERERGAGRSRLFRHSNRGGKTTAESRRFLFWGDGCAELPYTCPDGLPLADCQADSVNSFHSSQLLLASHLCPPPLPPPVCVWERDARSLEATRFQWRLSRSPRGITGVWRT